MIRTDFVQRIQESLTFLKANGDPVTFEKGNYFLYLNWTNKFITIHDARKSKRAPRGRSSTEAVDYLINSTDNGAWIGPFERFSKALAVAILLKKALLFHTHEEVSIGEVGLVDVPYKFL